MATRRPLTINKGETFKLSMTYYKDAARSAPVDLTGYRARMQIRRSADSASATYTATGGASRLRSLINFSGSGHPETAGIFASVFGSLENFFRYGYSGSSSNISPACVDEQIKLGQTDYDMFWCMGQLDSGLDVGPQDPSWDPTTYVEGTRVLCTPINPVKNVQMLGSRSWVDQWPIALGTGTERRQKMTSVRMYIGCAAATELSTTGSLPAMPGGGASSPLDSGATGLGLYVEPAYLCGASLIFDAETPLLWSLSLPQARLRQFCKDNNIEVRSEPHPYLSASEFRWRDGCKGYYVSWAYLNLVRNSGRSRNTRLPAEAAKIGLDTTFYVIGAGNQDEKIFQTKEILDERLYQVSVDMGDMTRDQIEDLVAYAGSTTNADIQIGASKGTIDIKIPASATRGFRAGSAVYDLELVAPNGDVTRLLEGPVTIAPEVTRVE